MITIEQYIKHIDNLKEMGLLSKDFRVVQYKDGCLLGVNGKCEAFEEKPLDFKDYIWWIDGYAYRPVYRARMQPTVVLGDEGENIAQMVPPYRSVGTARSGSVVPLISV